MESFKRKQQTTQRIESQSKRNRQAVKRNRQVFKETAKQLKETDSRFNTQWGKLMESLVEGKLVELLRDRGIEIRRTSQRHKVSYIKEDGQIQRKEFDILVVNGSEVVAVEVKTLLTPDKVNYFLSAMKDFKKYFQIIN